MSTVKETILHPDGNGGVDLYPKTNINQVEGLKGKIENLENFDTHLDLTKLTKPVNPTTNSVVTIADNGAVGTMPLNEIGGGGKLYLHNILIAIDTTGEKDVSLKIYSTSGTPITANSLYDTGEYPAYYRSGTDNSYGAISVSIMNNKVVSRGAVYNNVSFQLYNDIVNFTDTVTEI